MKRVSLLLVALALIFLLPRQASAVDLALYNKEQCTAKVALAYQRDGLQVVEGWYILGPNQTSTILLFGTDDDTVYALVRFEYSKIAQHVQPDTVTSEFSVQDTHFRYAGFAPEDLRLRKAVFQKISKRNELGGLLLHLGSTMSQSR